MPTRPILAANLRDIRNARGLTQTQAGDALGVKQSDISKWEKGAFPGCERLLDLATLYGVSLDEFVAGINSRYDASTVPTARQDTTPTPFSEMAKSICERLDQIAREMPGLQAVIYSTIDTVISTVELASTERKRKTRKQAGRK